MCFDTKYHQKHTDTETHHPRTPYTTVILPFWETFRFSSMKACTAAQHKTPLEGQESESAFTAPRQRNPAQGAELFSLCVGYPLNCELPCFRLGCALIAIHRKIGILWPLLVFALCRTGNFLRHSPLPWRHPCSFVKETARQFGRFHYNKLGGREEVYFHFFLGKCRR